MRALQRSAMTETVLEGVPLPAGKRELVEYAESQRPPAEVREALAGIPDQEYRTLNDVSEAIAQVQPQYEPPGPDELEPESGSVPGGDAYTDPSHESGWIREDPEILEYESQLVREPGKGAPEPGDKAEKPG